MRLSSPSLLSKILSEVSLLYLVRKFQRDTRIQSLLHPKHPESLLKHPELRFPPAAQDKSVCRFQLIRSCVFPRVHATICLLPPTHPGLRISSVPHDKFVCRFQSIRRCDSLQLLKTNLYVRLQSTRSCCKSVCHLQRIQSCVSRSFHTTNHRSPRCLLGTPQTGDSSSISATPAGRISDWGLLIDLRDACWTYLRPGNSSSIYATPVLSISGRGTPHRSLRRLC